MRTATGTQPIGHDPTTLAAEHARLMRDVRHRAASVLALAAARRWPEAELRVLTRYLRDKVLRQASDEETLLYPKDAPAASEELTAQHARLHTLIDHLDYVDAATRSLPELTQRIGELMSVLEQHLNAERSLLSALRSDPAEVPSTAALLHPAVPHPPAS